MLDDYSNDSLIPEWNFSQFSSLSEAYSKDPLKLNEKDKDHCFEIYAKNVPNLDRDKSDFSYYEIK